MFRFLGQKERRLETCRLPICASNNNIFLPEHGIILFCVAKAGNTSIKRAVIDALVEIGDPLTKDRWEGTNVPWINTHRHPSLRRTPLAQIARDPRTEGCFKAVFVRNPYDRLVSCYTERVLGGKSLGRIPVSKNMTFGEFVDVVCAVPDEEADIHIESQHRSFFHEGRNLADFVGAVETFAADWEVLRRVASLKLPVVGRENPSGSRRSCRAYYSDATAAKVRSRYEQDLRLLGRGYEVV